MKLLGLLADELKPMVTALGEPPYRAAQVYSRLQKGDAFEEMTALSKPFRAKLRERHDEGYLNILSKAAASTDGTVKYLFGMDGGDAVESVFMRYRHGNTICVSTQAGCRMGCVFCASGALGLRRDLTAGEMLAQVVQINRDQSPSGERAVSNIVLMGTGEPLDNYDNTVRFLRLLNDPDGLHIGARSISLSTCGIVPRMLDFIREDLPVTLCLSLHAADDEKRRRIVPAARAYPIAGVLAAAKKYYEKTGRRIIIEYTMIKGLNDSPGDADRLKAVLHGLCCHVNLIPLNAGAGPYCPPARSEVYAFLKRLHPLSATVRRTLGAEIEGACGQLRLRHTKAHNKES